MITTDRRIAFFVFAVALGTRAFAGEPDRAEQLFQKARDLMGKNDFAAACPMLEEAYALDHGAGTLLALALCHEGAGRPASALREYRESLSLAVTANRPDRVMLAESHVQKLEAMVPRVSVHPPTPEPAGLVITLDGITLERAALVAGAPVDPGTHTIIATVPDRPPWHGSVDVTTSSHSLIVEVPAWNAPQATLVVHRRPTWPRTLGIVLGAAGLVTAVGVGTSFGVEAYKQEDRSKKTCTDNVCSSQGVIENHSARHDAVISDVTFAVGGAALLAGLLLVLRYSLPPKERAHVSSDGAQLGITW